MLQSELVEKGETQFMLINVPPLDRAPLWKNTPNEKIIKDRVKGQFINLVICFFDWHTTMYIEYNTKLKVMVEQFKKSHPGIIALEYDAYDYFTTLLDNHNDYDIKDIDTFCPDWWVYA